MPDPHPLVCRFGAFGDMVLITPLLKHLYRRSGLACDVIGVGGWNRMLFAEMPYVRHVYAIDSRAAPYWFNRSQRELVAQLRKAQPQPAWICETDARSYRLLARAGIRAADHATQPDLPAVAAEHYCDTWLRLANLTPRGFELPPLETESANPELFVSDAERVECRAWLDGRGISSSAPIVCIQAGNKRTMRRGKVDRASNTKYWHESNWAEVVDGIVERDAAAQILLCGVPAERDMCEAIVAHSRHAQNLHVVADDLPMRRLLALLSMADSCISVDTGPAHAAAALNCPLVVLFGKANPDRFRPVSTASPIEILIGRSQDPLVSEPDISLIAPEKVLSAWENLRDSAR